MKRSAKLNALFQDETLLPSELNKITTEMLQTMRADRQFIRKVRERAFLAIQRDCERPLWQKLLGLAASRLNQQASDLALQAGILPPRPRAFHDWTQSQLRSVMAQIDEGLISNAFAVVTIEDTKKVASISLPTLIAILIDSGGNWPDLGSLPSFSRLRAAAYCPAIGMVQHKFCKFHGYASPKEEMPTHEELTQLDRCFQQHQFPLEAEDGFSESRRVRRRWGAGWLLARSILGLSPRGGDRP